MNFSPSSSPSADLPEEIQSHREPLPPTSELTTVKMSRKKKSPSPYDRINIDDDDEMIIEGYMWSLTRSFFFWCTTLLSSGFLVMLTTWEPSYQIKLTHTRSSLDQADKVILRDSYGEEYVETVVKPDYSRKERAQFSYFYHKKIKYLWRPELSQFTKLTGLEKEKCGSIYSMSEGLTNSDAKIRQSLYGINSIIIQVEPITKLILNQISNPFYVYQIFIILVWMIQLYYQFAGCVLLFSIISIALHVHETRKQSMALREKVHSESEIVVLREGVMASKSSTQLVPGDIIILAPNCSFIIECDAVLLSGSCTVDESMLTGESEPISKVALTDDPNTMYTPNSHKKNTLFCGTEIIHVQSSSDKIHVKALVVRIGYSTTKGELVRNILFPKPVNFQLKQDLIKCMILFFILGIPSMAYTAYIFVSFGASLYDTIIIVVDIATFLVPPLLPAVMTSINAYAQKRLRKAEIFCLDTNFINAGGSIDMVCFDKTGTLTEDSIDIAGVIPSVNGLFARPERKLTTLDRHGNLVAILTNCHSLIHRNKRLDGDRQEIRMFESVEGEFLDDTFVNENGAFERLPDRIIGFKNGPNDLIFGLIRLFPFDSTLQRMAVVVKRAHSNSYLVLMKGAPEAIRTFCIESSIPNDFDSMLASYTRDGMRVMAAASRIIDDNLVDLQGLVKMPREEIEHSMIFDGLIVFQNQLKPETEPTLTALKEVGIRTIMATGDNILTALSVARDCGMINEADSVVQVEARLINNGTLETLYRYVKLPGISEKLNIDESQMKYGDDIITPMIKKREWHVSIEGRSFELIRSYDRSLLAKIVHRGTIFARMLPDHKLHLIDEIQRQGHQVAMCGDGANDCGALRLANCGISLSMAESSVASPFTYTKKNIECVPILISEGRATLAATLGAFKYQASYCFVLLSAVLILFWEGAKLSDGGFVFIDIILNMFPPLVFGTTKAYPRLTRRRPLPSLFDFSPLFSIFSFVTIQIIIYLIAREYLLIQDWYQPFVFNATEIHRPESSHMTLTILSVNTMSYVIAAIIFASGPPFRMSFLTNKIYTFVVLLNFALVIIVTVYPAPGFLLDYVGFKDVPDIEYKLTLLSLGLANLGISYTWEAIFLQSDYSTGLNFCSKLIQWKRKKPLYQQIETELSLQDDWPPVIKATNQTYNNFNHNQLDDDDDNQHRYYADQHNQSTNIDNNWIHHCNTLPVDHRISLEPKRTLVTFTNQEYNVDNKTFD
ncbi:polyamine-transporting ATPase 13A3-like [Panonychus citri]|uniref:polyamine-transporting ATPase 13A3-like n=1 Tax=Panonychus citri TaxID=50023 RepID=UPI002306E49C|nr:polyamine-transporting ATPase 13A3-like [Panonychus citri]